MSWVRPAPGRDPASTGPWRTLRWWGSSVGCANIAAQLSISASTDDSLLLAGPALAEVTADAAGFQSVLVEARDGDVAAATAVIERTFGGRPFNLAPTFGPDDIEPAQEAIDYEARAALAFAAGRPRRGRLRRAGCRST